MTLTDLLARAGALVRDAAPAGDPLTWLGPLAARAGLAHVLDHTMLKAEATAADIRRTAEEGRALGTATVCVNGVWVATVAEALAGSPTGVAAVVGFPLGAMHPAAKAAEATRAVLDGATELDMVLQLGAALAGEWTQVHDDVAAVVQAAGAVPVKVILESAALPPLAVAMASLVSVRAGARYVKTSTGFHAAGGASVEAVRLMRQAVGPSVGVKASGGVRTAEQALAMLAAGADRIGTSGSAAICAGAGTGPLGALVRAAPAATDRGAPSTTPARSCARRADPRPGTPLRRREGRVHTRCALVGGGAAARRAARCSSGSWSSWSQRPHRRGLRGLYGTARSAIAGTSV